MKVGLEIHQQLSTGKLFCRCRAELSEAVQASFVRHLRATAGESGILDAAARLQASRGRAYRYETVENSCLVEADEEPPQPVDPRALDVSLTLSALLGAHPVDELVVMRKTVVDGSNTSGFQRTALVAVDGSLLLGKKPVGILSLCLEEDAARKTRENDQEVVYRLDRLGIPLLEIATAPDLTTGEEAREAAETIGALLRATRRVRRGIGSVREDLNVSIDGGARVEIKGVQELRWLARYVENEAERQARLLKVRDTLRERGAQPPTGAIVDVAGAFRSTANRNLSETFRQGGSAWAIALPRFGGLLGTSATGPERLGRELADHARAEGLGGILHSDELPGYGISPSEVEEVRRLLSLPSPEDAFVVVAHRERALALRAVEAVRSRASQALVGIPEETRDPLPEGRTRYSRPLPGRHRMYPETDLPPVRISPGMLETVAAHLPERPEETRRRLEQRAGLGAELADQLVRQGEVAVFDGLVDQGVVPSLAARTLTQDLPPLEERKGSPIAETDAERVHFLSPLLRSVGDGKIAKEGVPPVLERMVLGGEDLDSALAHSGLGSPSGPSLEAQIAEVLHEQEQLWKSRGMTAFQPLMGHLMRRLRGRVDGEVAARALRAALERRLGSSPEAPPSP